MRLTILAVLLGTLSSCGLVNGALTTPAAEQGVDASTTYLNNGPNTEVQLGADEKSLLREFAELNQAKNQLETQLQEIRSENEQLRAQLGNAERDRDRENNLKLGSERELERLSTLLREREAKILSMNIASAKQEQEILQLRIGSLQEQLNGLNAATSVDTTEASGPIRE